MINNMYIGMENSCYNGFDLLMARDEGYKYGMIETEALIHAYIDNLISFEHVSALSNDYQYKQGYIAAAQHIMSFIKENGRRTRKNG